MNAVLMRWNEAAISDAVSEVLPCCGAARWATALAELRPYKNESELFVTSDKIWRSLRSTDWDEAFRSHPRIGERKAPESAALQSTQWSTQEQYGVVAAALDVKEELARANRLYEERFGRIFIVCTSGKSAEEMLAMLHRRLENDELSELQEEAEQQRQITQLRLRKWLGI